MGKTTEIAWTDATFNPWLGCSKVSPGCQHCYAETLMDKRMGRVQWGPNGTRSATSAAYWKQPRAWNAEAQRTGVRRKVFCGSLCDWLEDRQDTNAWRISLLELIELTPNLDWLMLTKRPENAVRLIQQAAGRSVESFFERNPHVWFGVSVEDQRRADERIPHLLSIPASVRFLSMEPLLGPVDLSRWINQVEHCGYCGADYDVAEAVKNDAGKALDKCAECDHEGFMVSTWGREADAEYSEGDAGDAPDWNCGYGIHWVIIGGESGAEARPMNLEWARDIRDQCKAAGVPYFFKQWGEWYPFGEGYIEQDSVVHSPNGFVSDWTHRDLTFADNSVLRCHSSVFTFDPEKPSFQQMYRIGKKSAGRLLDGREWSEFPTIGVPST